MLIIHTYSFPEASERDFLELYLVYQSTGAIGAGIFFAYSLKVPVRSPI